MFNWLSFLQKYRIPYTEQGHTRNNIGIDCPFCGEMSGKFHMGISLVGKGWSCWKFQKIHGGKSPYRLIMALLHCAYSDAVRIVKDEENIVYNTTEDNFFDDFSRLMGVTKEQKPRYAPVIELKTPSNFRPLDDSQLARRLAFPYLNRRGYTDRAVYDLVDRFNLLFAYSGPCAYRVIIPIHMFGELINWTGRTISDSEGLRYQTLSTDPVKAQRQGLPVAKLSIKDSIFDYDNLVKGGDTLVVTEGPFDAMRITYLGEQDGILGTCLYNKTADFTQLELLKDLVPKFNRRFVMFDENTILNFFMTFPHDLSQQYKNVEIPKGYKDPAELDRRGFNLVFAN